MLSKAQQVDSLTFDNSSYLMMNKESFKEIANPDTCHNDPSGTFLYLNFRGKEYYGISREKFNNLCKKETNVNIKSTLLYNPNDNTVWGYRREYILTTYRK